MGKRKMTIEATLEADDNQFWVTCRVGRKTYRTHWKNSGPGSLSLVDGNDMDEETCDEWVREMYEHMEDGANALMRWDE